MPHFETGDRVIVLDADMEEYYTGTIFSFGTEKSIGFDNSVEITEICGKELHDKSQLTKRGKQVIKELLEEYPLGVERDRMVYGIWREEKKKV